MLSAEEAPPRSVSTTNTSQQFHGIIHVGQPASGRDSPVTVARASTKALTGILLSE